MVIWAGFQSPLWARLASAGNDRDAPRLYANHHSDIAETGKEGMVMPSEIGANLSWAVHHWRWRGKRKTRNCARRAGCGGISHYGGDFRTGVIWVAIRLKRPLIASLISGFICGRLPVWRGLPATQWQRRGYLQRAVLRSGESNEHRLGVRGHALAVVLSFILTLLLGFEDIPLRKRLPRRESIRAYNRPSPRSKS